MAERAVLRREALWQEATGRLAAAGVPEPRREARRLAREIRGADRGVAGYDPAGEVTAAFAAHYLAAVDRRATGEPLAHVIGWIGFRTLELAIDRRALIPRPETEGLVELALARVDRGIAADVGTGSGAIALSLKAEGRFDAVFGIDCSLDALALARTNGERTALDVTWLEGDLLAPFVGRQADLVVSNPPYLSDGEHEVLDPAVRDWEPALALRGGPDGLAPYRRLFAEAPAVLRPGGWLVLEVDARRADLTADLASHHGWRAVTLRDDLFGRARYLAARWGS